MEFSIILFILLVGYLYGIERRLKKINERLEDLEFVNGSQLAKRQESKNKIF